MSFSSFDLVLKVNESLQGKQFCSVVDVMQTLGWSSAIWTSISLLMVSVNSERFWPRFLMWQEITLVAC